jgi:hypothetical protein
MTRSTCVCCSITSETRIAYGSRVPRQGKSRRFAWNHARSSPFTGVRVSDTSAARSGFGSKDLTNAGSLGYNLLCDAPVVTIEEVRSFALQLPRTSEAVVRQRVKFRIGRIVYLAFSRDETVMGFAFPKEWREALVDSEPDKFMLPSQSDLRYNWVLVRLASIDAREMRELVLEAWQLVVPKRVAAAYGDLD